MKKYKRGKTIRRILAVLLLAVLIFQESEPLLGLIKAVAAENPYEDYYDLIAHMNKLEGGSSIGLGRPKTVVLSRRQTATAELSVDGPRSAKFDYVMLHVDAPYIYREFGTGKTGFAYTEAEALAKGDILGGVEVRFITADNVSEYTPRLSPEDMLRLLEMEEEDAEVPEEDPDGGEHTEDADGSGETEETPDGSGETEETPDGSGETEGETPGPDETGGAPSQEQADITENVNPLVEQAPSANTGNQPAAGNTKPGQETEPETEETEKPGTENTENPGTGDTDGTAPGTGNNGETETPGTGSTDETGKPGTDETEKPDTEGSEETEKPEDEEKPDEALEDEDLEGFLPEDLVPQLYGASGGNNLYDPRVYPAYPDSAQMKEGNPGSSAGEVWWRGHTAVGINGEIRNDSRPVVKAEYRFWVKKGEAIPEGTMATLYTWCQYEQYTPTQQGTEITYYMNGNVFKPANWQNYVPDDKNGYPFVQRDPWRGEGQGFLVYTNIDWRFNLETRKGMEDDKVLVWQKNNYASFKMTITNTSGMVDDGNGNLVLPSDPDEWVPDTTTFDEISIMAGAGDYTGGGVFRRYLFENGQPKLNPDYVGNSTDANILYTGKWMDNLLECVDYDVSRYDEAGGILILDVSELAPEDQDLENAEELLQKGAKRIGYHYTADTNFSFAVKGDVLYPPHMVVKYPGQDYPNEKVLRIFVPYTTNVSLAEPDTVFAADGTIYFGQKVEGGEEHEGQFPWMQDTEDAVYFEFPDLKASGDKKVKEEQQEAAVGQEIIYTIQNVGYDASGSGSALRPPMYRPSIIDVLPEQFDFTSLRFVVSKDRDHSGIVEEWLGGTDKLLGLGVAQEYQGQTQRYPMVEYRTKDDKWAPVPDPQIQREEEGDLVIYTMDYSRFFERERGYQEKHTIRINYKTTFSPEDECPGTVEIVGKSRKAGVMTNRAVVNFIQLNYYMYQLTDALEEGRIEDQLGHYPVDEVADEQFYIHNESEASPEFEKSDIKGKLWLHTIIKDEDNWDDEKLNTPLAYEVGRYFFHARNDADGQGYNTDFRITLPVTVTNKETQEPNKQGFLTTGIYVNRALLEAGEPQWQRDEDGAILYDDAGNPQEGPILTLTGTNGAVHTFTKSELLNMPGNPADKEPLHKNCVYLSFAEGSILKTELGQLEKIELTYSAFYGKRELEEEDPDAQQHQYMEIMGTCYTPSECKADLDYEVAGWRDRFTNKYVDNSLNEYQGKDDGTLIFEMANPTIDAVVNNLRGQRQELLPIPHKELFSYDISLGNDSTSVMKEGVATLILPVNGMDQGDPDVEGTGFIAQEFRMDLSHMLDKVNANNNWGVLTEIEFFEASAADPDQENKGALIRTLTEAELAAYIDPATLQLTLPGSLWDGHLLGAIRVHIKDVDAQMLPAHDETDINGTVIGTVPEKLFHLRVFGHGTTYEQDLIFQGNFEASTPPLVGAAEGLKKKEELDYEVNALYVDTNPSITLEKVQRFAGSSAPNWTENTRSPIYPVWPTGSRKKKQVWRDVFYAGDPLEVTASFSNFYGTERISAMIRAVLEFRIPARINMDVDNRPEGFLVESFRIPAAAAAHALTGGVDEITITGFDPAGAPLTVTLARDELYGTSSPVSMSGSDMLLEGDFWKNQGFGAVTEIKVIYAKLEGTAGASQPLQARLKGSTTFGGDHPVNVRLYTEEERKFSRTNYHDNTAWGSSLYDPEHAYTVHNGGNRGAGNHAHVDNGEGTSWVNGMPSSRTPGIPFGEDYDRRVISSEDSISPWMESLSTYVADQTVDGERRPMGVDQGPAQEIYVPHNKFEKQYHFYAGVNDAAKGVRDSILHIELPISRVTINGKEERKGFLFRELRIPKTELDKIKGVFRLEFVGTSYPGNLAYNGNAASGSLLLTKPEIASFIDGATGDLVVTRDDIENLRIQKGLPDMGDIRYIRVRFEDVPKNSAHVNNAVHVMVKGITTTYSDNNQWKALSRFYRPQYWNFGTNNSYFPEYYTNQDETVIHVVRPNPYVYVQARFEDEALGGTPNGASGQASAPNLAGSQTNTILNVPVGNLWDLEDYDRTLHSYRVYFGNKSYQAHSYSDLIKPVFDIDLPLRKEKKGFQVTAVTLDPDLLEYGTGCTMTLYSSDYDTTKAQDDLYNAGRFRVFTAADLKSLISGSGKIDLAADGQMKDWYLKSIRITYDNYEGDDSNNKQNFIGLEGILTTYADDDATSPNNINYGNLITASAVGKVPAEYDKFSMTTSHTVQAGGSFRPYKPQPGITVQPGSNGGYGGDKTTRPASIGAEAFYQIALTNAGMSRQYNTFLNTTLPVCDLPVMEDGSQSVGGFQLSRIVLGSDLIKKITRDGHVDLEALCLVEHQPLQLDADGKLDTSLPLPEKKRLTIRRVKDGDGNPVYASPSDAFPRYEAVYTQGNTEIKKVSINLNDYYVPGAGDAGGVLTIPYGVWNQDDFPMAYPEHVNLELGKYGSRYEGGADQAAVNLANAMRLYGTPQTYYYDENYVMSRYLKAESSLKEIYEQDDVTAKLYERTASSWAQLQLSPSNPTLSMTADQEKGGVKVGSAANLPLSYEDKDGLYYSMKLGNDSESGMSRPVLSVRLPMYDDAPTTAEQEEKRRGFQVTEIYLDKLLVGDGVTPTGYMDKNGNVYDQKPDGIDVTPIPDQGMADVAEIRILDAFLTDKNGDPLTYVIRDAELQAFLEARKTAADHSVRVPYTAWYDPSEPAGSKKCVKYPGTVEIVFSRFDPEKRGNDTGEVRLYGNATRYGDENTNQGRNNAANIQNPDSYYTEAGTSGTTPVTTQVPVAGNSLLADASFLDYVAGMDQKITPSDYKEAWAHAAFQVREPRPVHSAEIVYYNRKIESAATDRAATDGNTRWTVIPYAREYVSAWALFNDSISRMENFYFTMTPEIAADAQGDYRGFHTMDVIIRKELLEQAVIDKIVLTDKGDPARQIVIERTGPRQKPGDTPFAPASGNPYEAHNPGTKTRELPADIYAGSIYTITLPDGATKTLAKAVGGEYYGLADGVYTINEGDLVIPRDLIVDEGGMPNIGKIEVWGSDFLAGRTAPNTAVGRPLESQTQSHTQSILFVGINDEEPVGTSNNSHIHNGDTTYTLNQGVFCAYLYGHTDQQVADTNDKLTGGQDDKKGNNFKDVATEKHQRSEWDCSYVKTPKLYFDTTISAVFKEDTQRWDEQINNSNTGNGGANDRRFTDETLGEAVTRDNTATTGGNPPIYKPYSNHWHNDQYLDNQVLDVGNKALTGFTVDFRQYHSAAMYPSGENLYSNETILQDYNAAATVRMTIDLPADNFDAYYIKLRPALKPFVTNIQVNLADGGSYDIPVGDWQGNARGTTVNGGRSYTIGADNIYGEDANGDGVADWWRINLLDLDNPASRYATEAIAGYDPFDVLDKANEGHPYYRSPAAAVYKGNIRSVVITMNVNQDPAKPNAGNNLFQIIAADEGSWYWDTYESNGFETWPCQRANEDDTIHPTMTSRLQETRHSIEIAGRALTKTSGDSQDAQASVTTRLELGTLFHNDVEASVGNNPVDKKNQVTRLRYQDGANANQRRSSWSYLDYYHWYEWIYSHHYGCYCYTQRHWASWHSGHLYDTARIRIRRPSISLAKGLGSTADNMAFSAPNGNITWDLTREMSGGLPDYGGLRSYGLGLNQNRSYVTEKHPKHEEWYLHYDESHLYNEWYGLFTHVDSVTMEDTLPEISRTDGWYKGFFSRYVEADSSIADNVAYVKVTLSAHKTDPDTGDVKAEKAPSGDRVIYIQRDQLYGAKANQTYLGKVLFRYEDTDEHIDGKASGDEIDGDRLEAVMKDLAGENIITLGKNEYPSKVEFQVWNLPGHGDQTDEYDGVAPKENQSGNTKPDFYLFGNVCDIIDDVYHENHSEWGRDYCGQSSHNADYDWFKRSETIMNNAQIKPRVNHVTNGDWNYIFSAAEADTTLDPAKDKNNGYQLEMSSNQKFGPFSGYEESVGGYYSHYQSYLYAKRVQPDLKVQVQTLEDPSSGRDPASGTREKPTPLNDIYDYEADNITPQKTTWRMWATNQTQRRIDESNGGNNPTYPLDTGGTYYKDVQYRNLSPNGFRMEKIWIPVEFINESRNTGQGNVGYMDGVDEGTEATDTPDKRIDGVNKFVVSKFLLHTATKADQRNTRVDTANLSVPQIPADCEVFDLKAYVLDDMIRSSGLPADGRNKYVTLADADRQEITNPDQARYYCIDLEKMYLDGVSYTDGEGTHTLKPVKKDGEGTDYYLQLNTMAFEYDLEVRIPWMNNYVKNRERYFEPNTTKDATLTGEKGASAGRYQYDIDPADLLFEGVFADRHYTEEAYAKPGTPGWDSWNIDSKPTVDTDPLELNKRVCDWLFVHSNAAGVNAIQDMNPNSGNMQRCSEYVNYKMFRFRNRAAKINVAVNRLPYRNAAGSNDPDPNGDPGNTNRPEALNYGNGNDYSSSDSNQNRNNARPVDIAKLLPGDRIDYYVTAVNTKDLTHDGNGQEMGVTTWYHPAVRFDAPKGTRIARWYYMPAGFDLGELPKIDPETGDYILDADGNQIEGPVAIEKDPGNGYGFDFGDITAYDPNHKSPTSGKYMAVPHDTELADIYSGMEFEPPTIFGKLARSVGLFSMFQRGAAQETEDYRNDEVVRSIVWEMEGSVPINRGFVILVELEVELPEDKDGKPITSLSNLKNYDIGPSTVQYGSWDRAHGYDPFYFTSVRAENAAPESNYNGDALSGPGTAPFGSPFAKQETIQSASVVYQRLYNTNDKNFLTDQGGHEGTTARVTSSQMDYYFGSEAPEIAMEMIHNVDGEEARITVGNPVGTAGGKGVIANSQDRFISAMTLTIDFIAAGNVPPAGVDQLSMQGFYLNRMPSREEMLYNQKSSDGTYAADPDAVEDVPATLYVQLRGDLKADGTLKDGWADVPYDPDHPFAVRDKKDGYRLVYYPGNSEKQQYPDGYYLEDGQKVAVEPRQVVRLRVEYGYLSDRDASSNGTLYLPNFVLYGIGALAYTQGSAGADAYFYNYNVGLRQEWVLDMSAGDNYTNLEPGEATEQYQGMTADELQAAYEAGRIPKPADPADPAVTPDPDNPNENSEIERNSVKFSAENNDLWYQIRRRLPNIQLLTDQYASKDEAVNAGREAGGLVGYRPEQKLWNRVRIENKVNKSMTDPGGKRTSAQKKDGLANCTAADVLGTGEVYQPSLIDKVPVQYVDVPSSMLPAGGMGAVTDAPTEIDFPDDVTIIWKRLDENGNLVERELRADDPAEGYDLPKVTVYKVTAKDIGGMQSFDKAEMDGIHTKLQSHTGSGSNIVNYYTNGRKSPMDSAGTAEDAEYYIYTYTFKSADGTCALKPGDELEIVYPVTAHKSGLPMATYTGSGRNIYLSRPGEYLFTSRGKGEYIGQNNLYPVTADMSARMMDMDLLLHDAAFTGSRTGVRRSYIWTQDEHGANRLDPVISPVTGQPKLYRDDTKQKRSEFLSGSTVTMPGVANGYGVNGGNDNLGDYGANGNFWDLDIYNQARRQTIQVKADSTVVNNRPDEVAELQPKGFTDTGTMRDWYRYLMRARTFTAGAAGGASSPFDLGFEPFRLSADSGAVDGTPGTEDGENQKENLL